MTNGDITFGFGYNNAGQVVSRTLSNIAYSYVPLLQSKTYVPDGLNRYSSVSGIVFGYDGRGNLTSDGSRTFAYDLENHLLSVGSAGSLQLTYDPLGRLQTTQSSGVATRFLYDGDKLVAEYNGATLVRRYAHGAGVDEPLVWYQGATLADRRWIHTDHQGSVIGTSDNAGNGTLYSYGAYGEPANDNWSGSRFRYTGQIALPEGKLYHYKARVYDPQLGRFLQTDPIGYADDLSLYAYAYNDPANRTDPTGWYVTSCGDSDRRCGAAATEFERQRQVNLQSRDTGVVASARAFGDRGQDNGVKVNFLDNRTMTAQHGSRVNGETNAQLVGSTANVTVDLRNSLRGRDMRAVSAHEGTHVDQRQTLATSFNPTTGKYRATLNGTKMATESQAYRVGNSISHEFSSQREIDSHIQQEYQNLNQTLIPPEFTE